MSELASLIQGDRQNMTTINRYCVLELSKFKNDYHMNYIDLWYEKQLINYGKGQTPSRNTKKCAKVNIQYIDIII